MPRHNPMHPCFSQGRCYNFRGTLIWCHVIFHVLFYSSYPDSDNYSHYLYQMHDCASLAMVYLILLPSLIRWRMQYGWCIIGFTVIYFDIPCIDVSFRCDAIISWLVMEVVFVLKWNPITLHNINKFIIFLIVVPHFRSASFLGPVCTTR